MSVNPGEVTIKLDGKERVLKCSLRAYKAVNAMSGGFLAALKRVSECDADVISQLVCVGLGVRTSLEIEGIEEQIYKDGVTNFITPCVMFINNLTNGGREPSVEAEPSEGKDPS